MPATKRITKMAFILVPEMSGSSDRATVRAAQCACRVAFQMGLTPISPLLYYIPFLNHAEVEEHHRSVANQWLRRCDRIWLQFPQDNEGDYLDSLAYDILDENQRLKNRRPVHMLHPTGENAIGYVVVSVTKPAIDELLDANLTAGLTGRSI